jgi:ribosomal protein S18 acetylase RimI-like enzyme
MDIRVLRPSDIPHVQLANITNLPENYFCKYYLYHAMSWPQLSYVAVDVSISAPAKCGTLWKEFGSSLSGRKAEDRRRGSGVGEVGKKEGSQVQY